MLCFCSPVADGDTCSVLVENPPSELPRLVREGVHFRVAIPERMYLDSDPEFHLNMHITISYLLLFHINNRFLTIFRRSLLLFSFWILIGIMFLIDFTYFPFLLDLPGLHSQRLLLAWIKEHMGEGRMLIYCMTILMPAIMTLLMMVLMCPLMFQKESVSEKLHCNGDLKFFGESFPETLVAMHELRRIPKPSVTVSYEMLLFQNMVARIRNLGHPKFWKLWWKHWVMRPFFCFTAGVTNDTDTSTRYRWPLLLLWLPVSVLLLLLHVLPIFSIWANYMRYHWKAANDCSCKAESRIHQILKVPTLISMCIGILIFFLMVSVFLYIVILKCLPNLMSSQIVYFL